MRVVIIANGWLNQPFSLEPDDLVIAANGGVQHCLKNGIRPAYVIGDLDSLDKDLLARLGSIESRIIRYPTRKDYTDLELALKYAQELGADDILILAALGARWDQTIANILLCATTNVPSIKIIDGSQEMYFIKGGESVEIMGDPGDIVSLIALAGDAHGVSTQDLEYRLNDEVIGMGTTRGVSNTMLTHRATIHIKEGLLLCTIIHAN